MCWPVTWKPIPKLDLKYPTVLCSRTVFDAHIRELKDSPLNFSHGTFYGHCMQQRWIPCSISLECCAHFCFTQQLPGCYFSRRLHSVFPMVFKIFHSLNHPVHCSIIVTHTKYTLFIGGSETPSNAQQIYYLQIFIVQFIAWNPVHISLGLLEGCSLRFSTNIYFSIFNCVVPAVTS